MNGGQEKIDKAKWKLAKTWASLGSRGYKVSILSIGAAFAFNADTPVPDIDGPAPMRCFLDLRVDFEEVRSIRCVPKKEQNGLPVSISEVPNALDHLV